MDGYAIIMFVILLVQNMVYTFLFADVNIKSGVCIVDKQRSSMLVVSECGGERKFYLYDVYCNGQSSNLFLAIWNYLILKLFAGLVLSYYY